MPNPLHPARACCPVPSGSPGEASGRGMHPRRPRRTLVAFSASVSAAVLGAALLGVSAEPDSDYLVTEPWLVSLGGGKLGVEFLTYGRTASAVRYGVVDTHGVWLSGPRAISPSFGYATRPIRGYVVADADGRSYVAWNLYDSSREVEAFHYIRLDAGGNVLAAAGPLGSTPVLRDTYSIYPQTPAIRVSGDEIQIYWTSEGVRTKVVLDTGGQVLVPPGPTAPGDNGTELPARVRLSESFFDYTASAVASGEGTFYLWVRSYYAGSSRSPDIEYALRFRRVDGGAEEKVLYSTEDAWWLSKATSVVGLPLMAAGIVGSVVTASVLYERLWRGRAGPRSPP